MSKVDEIKQALEKTRNEIALVAYSSAGENDGSVSKMHALWAGSLKNTIEMLTEIQSEFKCPAGLTCSGDGLDCIGEGFCEAVDVTALKVREPQHAHLCLCSACMNAFIINKHIDQLISKGLLRASLATPAVPDENPEPELDWITSMKITSPALFNPKIVKKDHKSEIESRLEILTAPDGIPAVNKAMLTMWQRMDQIDGELTCKDGKAIKSLNIREIVYEAMQEGWDDICGDTGCHPLDISRSGKYLTFKPYHWADYIAGFIEQKLLSAAPKQDESFE